MHKTQLISWFPFSLYESKICWVLNFQEKIRFNRIRWKEITISDWEFDSRLMNFLHCVMFTFMEIYRNPTSSFHQIKAFPWQFVEMSLVWLLWTCGNKNVRTIKCITFQKIYLHHLIWSQLEIWILTRLNKMCMENSK